MTDSRKGILSSEAVVTVKLSTIVKQEAEKRSKIDVDAQTCGTHAAVRGSAVGDTCGPRAQLSQSQGSRLCGQADHARRRSSSFSASSIIPTPAARCNHSSPIPPLPMHMLPPVARHCHGVHRTDTDAAHPSYAESPVPMPMHIIGLKPPIMPTLRLFMVVRAREPVHLDGADRK